MKTKKKSLSKPKETKSTKGANKLEKMLQKEDMSKILLTQLTKIKIKSKITKHKTKEFKSELKSHSYDNTTLDINQLYFHKENKKQIVAYGSKIYLTSKQLELNCLPVNYLKRHQLSPTTRTKLIDWFIEIFFVFQLEPQTFFLSVDILDQYLNQSPSILKDKDMHLIGIVSLFIASKMEDTIPLRLINIIRQIGHDKFTQKQIKEMEIQLLTLISFDLIRVSQYDFILTYIYDFTLNNEAQCLKLNISPHMKAYENICVFLAKMMTLNDEFTSYSHSLKAICCIIAGYDILKSNSSNAFTKEMEHLLYQWILLLIDESDSDSNAEMISNVYKKLIQLYSNFDKKNKGSNLSKTHELYFY